MSTKRRATLLPPPVDDPTKAQIEQDLAITPLTAFGPDIFTNSRAPWHPPNARGIFGGSAIAYCLSAAQATMPKTPVFAPHSCHCYFLLAGQPDVPIILHVERVRDGRSFATRTVQARQNGRCIFTMTVSFVRVDDDDQDSASEKIDKKKDPVLEHAYPMPKDVTQPTAEHDAALESTTENKIANPIVSHPFGSTGVEMAGTGEPHERSCRAWFRAKGKISGPMSTHLAALAYVSDSGFLMTVLRAHVAYRRDKYIGAVRPNTPVPSKSVGLEGPPTSYKAQDELPEDQRFEIGMVVSLDHTIYFHNPKKVRADEWMLSDIVTSWAGDNRGLVTQRIYARDGTLLVTCVQEGVIRLKEAKKAVPKGEAKL